MPVTTTGYEKRKAIDEAVRYEAGRQRGLNGEIVLDKKGHTKPFLNGIRDGRKERARESSRRNAAKASRCNVVAAKVRAANREVAEQARRIAVEKTRMEFEFAERRTEEENVKYLKVLDEALERARNA